MKVDDKLNADKISIIVPVHNAEKWIGRCLTSILRQTYENLEVLVIDDGSEDSSLEIIKKFQGNDTRIKVFQQTNQGVAAARNMGLINATGSILTFVDADDYLEEAMYHIMLSELQKQNADIVECSCQKETEYGSILQNICLTREEITGKKACVRHYLLQKNVRNYNWNKLYKRSLFQGVFYPKLRFSEDYYINAVVHARAEKKVILPDVLYHYTIHDVQTTNINKISLANYDGMKAGALTAKYFKFDKEVCTYAAIYACDYCIDVTKKYLTKYPGEWKLLRQYFYKDFLYCCLKISSAQAEKRRQYLLKGELENGVFIQDYLELIQKNKRYEKKDRLFRIMHRWLLNSQSGIKIADYLLEKGFESVAVYGVGILGECLISELLNSKVSVNYVIDKRALNLSIPVYKMQDTLPDVDCVIVTAVMEYEEICRQLESKINCAVISIEDIIFKNING